MSESQFEIACGCGRETFHAVSTDDTDRVAIVCPDCDTTMWVIARD